MADNTKLTGLFSDIADAIRYKDGTKQSIPATAFPSRIRTMTTGEDLDAEMREQDYVIAELTTAVAELAESGVGGGGREPVLESVTVTPTGETFTVTPDDGVDGFDLVRVKGDYNLAPENIADGITIYGVEGTLKIGASETVPPEYESFVEAAKQLYSGDYANMAILESNNKLNVAFLMSDFTVLTYDETSTEFTAKGWLYCEYTKDTKTWRVADHTTAASTGTNYVRHIRYSSVYWEYNGKTIWPMGVNGGGEGSGGLGFDYSSDANGSNSFFVASNFVFSADMFTFTSSAELGE